MDDLREADNHRAVDLILCLFKLFGFVKNARIEDKA